MKRSPMPARSAPLRRASKADREGRREYVKHPLPAPRRQTPKAVSDAVTARAAGRCEACGRPCLAAVLHHRVLRSQGGRDTCDNLLWLHPHCHDAQFPGGVHRWPAAARECGLLVPPWRNPAHVGVDRQGWLAFLHGLAAAGAA